MKTLLFSVCLLICFTSFGQGTERVVNEINELYAANSPEAAKGTRFQYDSTSHILEYGSLQIPLSENTLIQHTSQSDGKHKDQVNFFLQKGTVVTDKNDPTFKRASYGIPFTSRKAALKFIKLLNTLSKS